MKSESDSLRSSARRSGTSAARQTLTFRLMLGSLEINDDEAAFHHAKHGVEKARAVARLVNDLRETLEAGR